MDSLKKTAAVCASIPVAAAAAIVCPLPVVVLGLGIVGIPVGMKKLVDYERDNNVNF